MRAWIASVRALPMTFALYVFEAVLAALGVFPLANELARRAPTTNDAIGLAQWLERIPSQGASARVGAVGVALACAALLLVSPCLHMGWLSALSRRESVMDSLHQGVRLWIRACLVSLWIAAALALSAVPFAAAGWGISRVLARQLNDRVHDLVIVSALPLLAAFAFFAHVWHDLARARALHEGAFTSMRRSLRAAVRLSVLLRALLWGGLGGLLVVASQLLARDHAGALLLVGPLQLAILTRLLLRSRWLADALACADEGAESRAPEAFTEDRG